VLWNFNKAQTYLINNVKKKLGAELSSGNGTNEKDYKPHIALFITFLQLFANARYLVNSFTKKHLEFYYFTVLQAKLSGNKPDLVNICFQLVKGIDEVLITKGTLITGGKDAAGNEILFATNADIEVNNISVSTLTNLYLEKSSQFSINKLQDNNSLLVTGIYTSVCPANLSAAGASWPPFGIDQNVDKTTMQNAEIGLAISSAVLFLKESDRRIVLEIYFLPASVQRVMALFKSVYPPGETDDEFGLDNLLAIAFDFYITTSKTWVQIQPASYSADEVAGCITFAFSFVATDDPIVAFNPALHTGNFSTAWPVLKMGLNIRLPPFGYSFFSLLILSSVKISVAVNKLKTLVLYNNNGKVDGSKPFQPFGPVPVLGTYLVVGNDELAQKKIKSVNFNIQWFGLPPDGFYSYYSSYTGLAIQNDTFKVDISILGNGEWEIPPNTISTNLILFASEKDAKGKLLPEQTLVLDEGDTDNFIALPVPSYAPGDPLVFTTASLGGFYKIYLSDPPFAFGNSVYPGFLSATIMKNAEAIIRNTKRADDKDTFPILPLPNPPYIPVIELLTVDYTAEETFTVGDVSAQSLSPSISIFHITPFAQYEIFAENSAFASGMTEAVAATINYSSLLPANQTSSPTFLPYFDKQGYLFIGLQNIQPLQPVRILFQLISNYFSDSDAVPSVLYWQYLVNNEWMELDNNLEFVDGTNKFVRSGIVKFNLPGNITADNTIMPAGYWIRVCIDDVPGILCDIIDVQTQVTTATRVLNATSSVINIGNLPPFTLTKFVTPLPQIKLISQPYSSTGGRYAEDTISFYNRISERLKHKQRCITPWDYERMVLQQFPSIYYTRCISFAKPGNANAPGNVLILVLPNISNQLSFNKYAPKISLEILSTIKDYISVFTSPNITLHITNPIYVFVTVTCSVEFITDDANDYYISQLKNDLFTYFSPWIAGTSMKYNIEANINQNNILNFIIKLKYVKAVGNNFSILLMKEANDGSGLKKMISKDNPLEPWCVFASADDHNISMINYNAPVAPAKVTAIPALKIGTDFIVRKDI